MVHIGITNSMRRRSVPAIALRELNNNAGYYFMSLYTGRELHSNQWEELPTDDDVIEMVENLAKNEEQPLLPDKYPMFEWSPGNLIGDDDNLDEEDQDNLNDEVLYFEMKRKMKMMNYMKKTKIMKKMIIVKMQKSMKKKDF